MSSAAGWAGRTVIYGGSFDPPHMGHQMACLALLEAVGCEQVWLMPAYTHPFGKVLSAFAHRLAMCKMLAAPFGSRVQVSTAERDLGGAGRTFDLLVSLKAAHPGRLWALAVGADIAGQLPLWHRWPELEGMLPVVVIGRSGYAASAHTPDLPAIASSQLQQLLRAGHDVSGQLPTSVLAYVQTHKLYGSTGP